MTDPTDPTDPTAGSSDWSTWRQRVDLGEYDDRWQRMAAAGENPHGEADLVCRYRPASALDAGCGTGRVGIELARQGIAVDGVDLDADLLARAREKAPEITWHLSDLATLDLGRTFDVVVMAGNVVGFVAATDRHAAVAAVARHVAPGGRLISGCQLRAGWPTTDEYDAWCEAAGLELEDRFATWSGDALGPSPDYSVAVHHRPPA